MGDIFLLYIFTYCIGVILTTIIILTTNIYNNNPIYDFNDNINLLLDMCFTLIPVVNFILPIYIVAKYVLPKNDN